MAYFSALGGTGGASATITVTYSEDFYGQTITATNGTTTLTKTATSSGEVVFTVKEGGSWVVSSTVEGQTYSKTVNIQFEFVTQLIAIPDGSTVTPVNVIQTWLKCADIRDKSYTTLSQVLADTETFIALCADSNACNYMARSTNWASGVAADSTAMLIVGKYNYCANALLDDNTWETAIRNSPYSDYVNPDPSAGYIPLVPKMTSNTTPSGECSATDHTGSQYPYLAFDGNDSTYWLSASTSSSSANKYLTYQFPDKVKVSKIFMLPFVDSNGSHVKDFEIQASNDGTNWTKLIEDTYPNNDTSGYTEQYNTPIEYQYFRVYIKNFYAGNYAGIATFQVYRTPTNTLIHSAVEDSIFYMNDGSPVALCGIPIGDTIDVDLEAYKGQTLTLVSTVAKDPTNLSNDFTMPVRITPNITEIYLMPWGAVYWWGHNDAINPIEGASTTTGWISNTYDAPAFNKNNVLISSSTNGHICGLSTRNKMLCTKAHGLVTYNSGSSGIWGISETKQTYSNTWQFIEVYNLSANTLTHVEKTPSDATKSYNIGGYGAGGSVVNYTVSAIWIE